MLALHDGVGRACARLKAGGAYLWCHRTKLVGAVGFAAGGAEAWIEEHPGVHLPHRGAGLMLFGAIVILVGFYNKLVAP